MAPKVSRPVWPGYSRGGSDSAVVIALSLGSTLEPPLAGALRAEQGMPTTARSGTRKAVFRAFGLAIFSLTQSVLHDADPLLRWGLLPWYATVGAIISLFDAYIRHPVLKPPMPWWVRVVPQSPCTAEGPFSGLSA